MLRSALLALALTAIAAPGFSQAPERPKVKVDTGVLAGVTKDGVSSFKAIPFALPPVGALRWKPPQRPLRWSGDRDASQFALPCSQPVSADGKANGGGVSGAPAQSCPRFPSGARGTD